MERGIQLCAGDDKKGFGMVLIRRTVMFLGFVSLGVAYPITSSMSKYGLRNWLD